MFYALVLLSLKVKAPLSVFCKYYFVYKFYLKQKAHSSLFGVRVCVFHDVSSLFSTAFLCPFDINFYKDRYNKHTKQFLFTLFCGLYII